MGSNKEKTKNQIKNLLKKEKGVLFAYLFGSVALEKTNNESDIDLALYFKPSTKDFFDTRLKYIKKLSQDLGTEVDIVVLNTAPPFIRYVVLKEGELVFSNNEDKRIDFELKSLNEYFDYKPTIEKYKERMHTT